MDYKMHYERLIERARNRMLDGYVETHHVIPRCMGGTNVMGNLVQLTPEEHYVAHQLLCKMHPDLHSLSFAAVAMTTTNSRGTRLRDNKLYGWLRRKHAKATSVLSIEMWKDPEYRAKHKAAMDEVRSRPGYGEQFSRIHKGRVKSDQERANIAEAGRNRKPRKFSDEARANMAAARKRTWEERRANGTDKLIAQKTKATRIKNGSYEFSDEHRAAIGRASIGRTPWNKGIGKQH